MITQEIILKNEEGLHARPATEIAKSANNYNCTIKFEWLEPRKVGSL